jgi:hypothetical protein
MSNLTISTIHGPVRLSEAETAAHAALQDGRAVRPLGEQTAPDDAGVYATMATMLSLVALRVARWEHGGIVATLAPASLDDDADGRNECDACGEDLSPGEGFTVCRVCAAERVAS